MAKKCAYCARIRKFTKEHVWPNCFLQKLNGNYAHYSPKSGKVHGADYVVKDVCEECNNTKLNELDSYFCSLYDDFFKIPKGFDENVVFKYKYNLLARTLLKITYNTARSAGSEIEPFKYLREYILDGCNKMTKFVLIAELVSPTIIKNTSGNDEVLYPDGIYRSTLGMLKTPHGDAVLLRSIAVYSFWFHILISRKGKNEKYFSKAVSEFLHGIKGTKLLSPKKKSVILQTSPQDSISSIMPLLKKKHSEYKYYFKR